MNWTDIISVMIKINYGFWALIFAQIFASSVLIGWILFRRKFERAGSIKLIYIFLKWVPVLYIVPVVFIGEYILFLYRKGTTNPFMISNPEIALAELGAVVLWLAGSLLLGFKAYRRSKKFKKLKKYVNEAPEGLQLLLNDLCKEMRIKKKISLYVLNETGVPFIAGSLKPAVYLPEQNYDYKTLEVILRHELTHYRHKDIWTKLLMAGTQILYWYNPLVKILWRDYEKYSESYCDYEVCEQMGGCTEYFSVLFKQMSGLSIYPDGAALKEDGGKLMERVKLMKKWKISGKKKKTSAFLVMAVILGLSSMTALAAEKEIGKAYWHIFWETAEQSEEEIQPVAELQEFTGNIYDEGTEIIQEDGRLERGANHISVNLKNNTTWESQVFYKKAGESVYISVSAEPLNKRIRVGIVDANGKMTYVSSSGDMAHTFNIIKSDYYRVFVMNKSGTNVNVVGHYRV